MTTLNKIAERIAYSLNDPFNIMLLQNIKFSVNNMRATFIRRDITANNLSPEYLQRVKISFTKVDKADACNLNLDCVKVLKSTTHIPQYLRWKADVPFKFFGTLDGKSFTYTEYEELPYTCYNRFTNNIVRYALINGYAYVFNNTLLKHAFLEHIFIDPNEANTLCAGCYTDDSPYPCPADMVQQIIQTILQTEFKVVPENEQVVIDTPTK